MSGGLAAPARSLVWRGSRWAALGSLTARDGPILILRSGSVPWADEAAQALRAAGREVSVIAARGEPTLETLETALKDHRALRPKDVLAIGGGSVIDLAKALAALLPSASDPLDHLEVVGRGLPLIEDPLPLTAVPSTAGTGAEATKNAVIGVAAQGRKVSLRDARMIPSLAVLDAELTDGLPWDVTLSTGMDAVTQLIEPFLSRNATPASDVVCRAAITPGLRALATLSKTECPEARDTLLRAAHLSGIALANAGLGAVHGLAGVLGGLTDGAHGALCARLLPDVLEANRDGCAAAGLSLARFDELDGMVRAAFDAGDGRASDLIRSFLDGGGLPDLSGIAGRPFDAETIAGMAADSSSMKYNPVALSAERLVQVLNA